MFSCELCEISQNTFFTEHLWTTASKTIWIDFGLNNKRKDFVTSSYFPHVFYFDNDSNCEQSKSWIAKAYHIEGEY